MASRTIGECCLRWTDHDSLLQLVCNNLLTTEKFADVTLYCEGVGLKCHKFILSACSSYFEQILSESPSDHPIIILRDVPYGQMQALLHFIYKGELITEETKLTSLIDLARSLQIKGIGEFESDVDEVTTNAPKKNQNLSSQEMTLNKNMKDYLRVGNTMNHSTPNRLISLSPDSHVKQLSVPDPLSAPIDDASDFSLQEAEVEYIFESESLDDSQHIDEHILEEYPEDINVNRRTLREKRDVSYVVTDMSEVEDSISDTSASNVTTSSAVYKRYSFESLHAGIKAILERGVKQYDACLKYGIPFTTMTRKLRLYQACGGRLPPASKRKKRAGSSNVIKGTSVVSVDSPSCSSSSNKKKKFTSTPSKDTTSEMDDRPVLVIENVTSGVEVEPLPSFKQYKTYSEKNLKAAIQAVLSNRMRIQAASTCYKIPLSTLSRKIRSSKPDIQTSSSKGKKNQ